MRLNINEYFMSVAEVVSTRSTCLRRQVGCILVKNKNILATGYNGAPINCKHCNKNLCIRSKNNIPSGERHELCRGVHAEQNAIIQAAKNGTNINGATAYCTLVPCAICAKMLINAGVVKVYYRGEYNEKLGLALFKEAGVQLVQMK